MALDAVGRFRLHRKLANGNMGEVFLAEHQSDTRFKRVVVVKRLFPHLAHHPEAVRMFQDEAHVLAAMNHPNIPQIYDYGFTDSHWFLAIEYVPGHTLAELCAAGARAAAPMTLDVIVAALEQLCDALHHAHERRDPDGRPLRIVHRDVTPSNLMITPEGYAKLLDFGVARTAREESKGGALKGTLAYMAPEQVRAQRLDKRSDVFSVGVMLYELTTGRRLFYGSEIEVMTAIVEREITPPSVWVPGYPSDLERIVMTALARDRSRRFPSAYHLARELEEYVACHGLMATHHALARYYARVFTEEERTERGSGAIRLHRADLASGETPISGVLSSGAVLDVTALDDLRSRLGQPLHEPSSRESPAPLRLPAADDFPQDQTAHIVLTRPKK